MRTKIVAGNWKMNNTKKESKQLIKDLKKSIKKEKLENTRVIVAPTFVNLSSSLKAAKYSKIEVVAQICIRLKMELILAKFLRTC